MPPCTRGSYSLCLSSEFASGGGGAGSDCRSRSCSHDPCLRLFTDSNLDSYTCDGAKSLGTSVCGELFKIAILDNDAPGVQVGAVPPADTGLLAGPYILTRFQLNLSRVSLTPNMIIPQTC